MKVLAINGSARPKANTYQVLGLLKELLEKEDIEVEIINLATKKLNPCKACGWCAGKMKCIQDDDINEIFQKIIAADGIILGSPTYYSNVSSRMMMFIERTGTMSNSNGNVHKGKVGASVAIARRAGENFAYAALNFYFGILEMPIATSSYWNILIGRNPGEALLDEEGVKTMTNLAANMSHMLKKLR